MNASCLFRIQLDEDNDLVELHPIMLPFPPVKATRKPVALLSKAEIEVQLIGQNDSNKFLELPVISLNLF